MYCEGFFRRAHQIHNERRVGLVWFSCLQIHIKMSDTKTRTQPKGFYTSQAMFMIFYIVSCIFLDPYHPSAFFLYILFAILSVTFANFHFCINNVAKRTENEKRKITHSKWSFIKLPRNNCCASRFLVLSRNCNASYKWLMSFRHEIPTQFRM